MATKKKVTRKATKKPVKAKRIIEPVPDLKEYIPARKPESPILITIGKVLQILGLVAFVVGLFDILWPWWAGIIILIVLFIVGGMIKKAGRN
jgi:fatty acid desaturase